MVLRALLFLTLAVGLSVWATMYFGADVLIALGLILTQAKVLLQKMMTLKPVVLMAWFKTHLFVFFRKDLPYKWLSSVVVPLVLGKALFRRIGSLVSKLTAPIVAQRDRLMTWYSARTGLEKGLLTVSLVLLSLALAVTTVGLWLVLFSVGLPLWVISSFIALGRMLLSSVEKYAFKALAFLQLRWLARFTARVFPKSWVQWKRRFDFRVARAVVRRRRLTVQQLAQRKDRLPFRFGLLVAFVFLPSTGQRDSPED